MAVIGPYFPSGGLSTESNVFTIPEDKALTLSDVYLSHGVLKNRPTMAKLNATSYAGSHPVIGIGIWTDPAQALSLTNSPIVVLVNNAKIWSAVLSSSMTFTDVTGAVTVGGDAGFSIYYTFASLNGLLIIAGGSSTGTVLFKISAYNGNAANLGGTPPKGDVVVAVNNFLFLGRDLSASSKYSRVYWSAVGDPETWPAANFVDFRLSDGDTITALASIGNQLVIFKNRSIGILQTTTTASSGTVSLGPLSTVSEKIGCAGPRAVSKLPDGRLIFFSSDYRVYIFDGSSLECVSSQATPGPSIQDQLMTYLYPQNITQTVLEVNASKNLCYVTIRGQSTAISFTWAYNYVENTWTSQSVFYNSGNSAYLYDFKYCSANQSNTAVSNFIIVGDALGNIWNIDSFFSAGYANDTIGNPINPVIEMSVKLPDQFIPRTLLIPALVTGGALTATVGYNGTYESTTLTAITSRGSNWNLFDVRNTFSELARPLNMQIKIQGSQVITNPVFTMYPFYISDEVLS